MTASSSPARAAVIMAAGQGTRMKSPIPKLLHRVGGRTLLDRVIDTVQAAGCARIVVVVGNHSPGVRALVFGWLGRVDNANAKGEYYITDIVALASGEEKVVRAHFAPESAVMGADTPAQLAAAEAIFQARARALFLAEGVAMTAPDTVH